MNLSNTGLPEHLLRARFFLEQSQGEADPQKKSWFIMASVYPARAVVEVTVDYFKTGKLKGEFRDFLSVAAEKVRYFKTIEYLRDHDFHRRAVRFVPGRQAMFGPIRLSTGNSPRGSAAFIGAMGEPLEAQTGKSGYVKQDRPVQIRGFEIDIEEEGWGIN